jgi:hypothetical protein
MREYMVIKDNSPEEFSKLVTEALNNGWDLVGGLSTTCYINEQKVKQMFKNYKHYIQLWQKIKNNF